MSLRTSVAIALGRLTSWGLRDLLHRNASQLPGRVALGIDSQVIAALAGKLQKGSIVICGTNGKTTTSNIVASAIEATGKRVLCNRVGANMAPGVAAALLPGKTADWAVIEADELSTIHILPQLRPKYLVLLNLFRDQLDRAGEIEHVQDVIVSALQASPETCLVCCGDDPLSVGVAYRAAHAGTQVLSFGIGEDLDQAADRVPEARFCQRCGAELSYDYRSYAQLGAFRCPNCDFARPELDFVAREVRVGREGITFSVSRPGFSNERPLQLHADFGGVYMVYNLLAAYAAAHLVAVDAASFQRTIDTFKPANGRLQHFNVYGREVVLNLAKNPTGFNQNISLLLADKRPKYVHIAINDKVNDGKDISWIWDVDFERLSDDENPIQVYCSGSRANDLQIRLKYAGIASSISENVKSTLASLDASDTTQTLYVLTNYSALWPAKAELEEMRARHV